MEKVYSIKERMIYTPLIVILGLFQLTLLLNYSDNITIVVIAYTCIAFIVALLLKLFSIPYHIIVKNNIMKVYDFPWFATNKFYYKKRGLILWNSEINIDEVEKVEIVKLSKKEKLKFIGYNHLFSKYLKVYIKNSHTHKYVYISIYTNKQINKIIRCFNSEKDKKIY